MIEKIKKNNYSLEALKKNNISIKYVSHGESGITFLISDDDNHKMIMKVFCTPERKKALLQEYAGIQLDTPVQSDDSEYSSSIYNNVVRSRVFSTSSYDDELKDKNYIFIESFQNEVNILTHLKNTGCDFVPNILSSSHEYIDAEKIIVMEYIEKDTLPKDFLPKDFFDNVKKLNKKLIDKYNVYHNDTAVNNVIYSKGKLYLIDFAYSFWIKEPDDIKIENNIRYIKLDPFKIRCIQKLGFSLNKGKLSEEYLSVINLLRMYEPFKKYEKIINLYEVYKEKLENDKLNEEIKFILKILNKHANKAQNKLKTDKVLKRDLNLSMLDKLIIEAMGERQN